VIQKEREIKYQIPKDIFFERMSGSSRSNNPWHVGSDSFWIVAKDYILYTGEFLPYKESDIISHKLSFYCQGLGYILYHVIQL